MYDLVLVSQSPRRRELLENAGFLFRVDTVKVSEIIDKNVNLGRAVADVAQTKAEAYLKLNNHLKSQDILVLAADTIVALNGNILGKPKNLAEAENFLRMLSGCTHSVITGLYISNLATGESYKGFEKSEVTFRELGTDEILQYVLSGEPMDKAGAYAIQGEGKKFVARLDGSYSNVVGLPMEHFEQVLMEKNWRVKRR